MSKEVMVDIDSLNVAMVSLKVSMAVNKEIPKSVLQQGLSKACEDDEFGDVFCDVVAEELASEIKSNKSVQLGEKVDVGIKAPVKVMNRVSQLLYGCKTSW